MMKIKNKIFVADNEGEARWRIGNSMYVQYCSLANVFSRNKNVV